MPTEKTLLHCFSPSQDQPAPSVTRRHMLRLMAGTSVTLVGGATLAACGGSNSSPTAQKVTLYTAGWPIDVMPTQAAQAKDPSVKAYGQALKKWLDKNPGVTLKSSTVNIWDTKALTTAISANTAPAFYGSGTLGNYNEATIRTAMLKGFAADVTPYYSQYNLASQMPDYARTSFETWNMNGKYFVAPSDYLIGSGIVYRKDWIKEAGLQEPQIGWTWSDFATLAKGLTKGKRKGAAAQQWIMDWMLRTNGFDLLSKIPAPSTGWHWKFDYTANMNKWVNVTNIWRQMYFTDKSVLSDSNYDDDAVSKAFARGDAGMQANNSGFFTRVPTDTEGVAYLADSLHKNVDDIAGYVAHPVGANGEIGSTQGGMGTLCFDPHLNSSQISKAYDLYVYFFFGQGFIDQKVATYQANKDLRYVFDTPTPRNKITSFPGVPGTFVDAWGQHFSDSIQKILAIPTLPDPALYFPAEQNTGPDNSAYQDARSALTYSQKSIPDALTHFNQVINQQATGFTSSVDQSTFTTAAQKYYRDLDKFWQTNAPDFYNNEFHPWYEKNVVPAVGA